MSRIRKTARRVFACLFLCFAGAHAADATEPPYALLNEWWQWALSIPSAVNPILDNNGARCTLGQRGNLWFLAGNTGGRTVRECVLPARSRVLIPVHSSFCVPEPAFTVEQCLETSVADWSSFTLAEATLDGVSQVLIDQPPVPGESEFTFAVPRNGLFSFKPGLYRATIAGGRWAIVDLPEAGLYTLRVRSRSTYGFSLDVTYRLTVAEVN